ncbi:PepSY domain-containing protein [Pseudomonas aeruginosa]
MRPVLVLLHRYVGLATALFLFLAGLTGSLLAFHHEIDEWLNPGFYAVGEGGERLCPGSLVQRVESRYPRQLVWYMEYPEAGGGSGVARHRAARGRRQGRARRVLPRPGQRRGSRQAPLGGLLLPAGEPGSLGLEFHHNLTLPGNWGLYLMGGVADVLVPRLLRRRLADPAARPAVLEQVDDSLEESSAATPTASTSTCIAPAASGSGCCWRRWR